jgi:hypothetical protein
MKDDFDNEMGLPDEELAGDEPSGDEGEPLLGSIEEVDVITIEPAGRPSGGARAQRSSSTPARAKKAAPRRAAAKKSASKASKGRAAKKKAAPPKAAPKGGKKSAGKKAAGKKSAGKKRAGKKR